MSTPPSLAWVPMFAESANRALDGGIFMWNLEATVDPLQWKLVLVAGDRPAWTAIMSAHLRLMLGHWAKVNRAVVLRARISQSKPIAWVALIVIRGLGPEMKVNPYVDDEAARRARRRLPEKP